MVMDRARRTVALMGEPRAIVLLLLVIAGCIGSTWKQLVQSLYIGLTGRAWLVKASVFGALALLCLVGPIADWVIGSRQAEAVIWDAIPCALAVLAAGKMAAAAWVAVRLYHSRLLPDRTLVLGAAGWCAAVLALYAVLVWWLATDFFPNYLFALVAILAVPLARVSAAPLAVAWNRHR
jgi:hypothetical protein